MYVYLVEMFKSPSMFLISLVSSMTLHKPPSSSLPHITTLQPSFHPCFTIFFSPLPYESKPHPHMSISRRSIVRSLTCAPQPDQHLIPNIVHHHQRTTMTDDISNSPGTHPMIPQTRSWIKNCKKHPRQFKLFITSQTKLRRCNVFRVR
jgi:hypothetical protein